LGVWDKMMRGLSTRNYGAVVKEFQNAYGIEKSAVSENFIEASREKVKDLMERPLSELRLCAIVIDGTPFKDRQMIAALGIGCDGSKTVLGIREGATENTAVASSLLSELVERGLDFSTPRLYILDGGKALHAAVRKQAGEAAFIQRCQVHKKRNVIDHLPDEHKAEVNRKLQNAYAMLDYADAKRALERLHREYSRNGHTSPPRRSCFHPARTSDNRNNTGLQRSGRFCRYSVDTIGKSCLIMTLTYDPCKLLKTWGRARGS
jgi:putative transposase